MVSLPEKFIVSQKSLLGDQFQDYLESFHRPPLRIAWHIPHKENAPILHGKSEIILDVDFKAGKDPYWHAGCYYCQDPSAMEPVRALFRYCDPGLVLDLCAAPGGKSIQVATRLKPGATLVSNEVIRSRFSILYENVERTGLLNTLLTNEDPKRLAKRFPGFFEAIIIDAPCSGEGMFRKYPHTVEEWSPELVKLCAQRQKRILRKALECLAPGGFLLYSTCTFNREENEAVLESVLDSKDFICLESRRIYPHELSGEGQFFALYQCKKEKIRVRIPEYRSKQQLPGDLLRIFQSTAIQNWNVSGGFREESGKIYYQPAQLWDLSKKADLRQKIEILKMIRGHRKTALKPHHSFAMLCQDESVNQSVSLTMEQAFLFLRGEEFTISGTNVGWNLLCVGKQGLGWGKLDARGRLKNHLPSALRLRNY